MSVKAVVVGSGLGGLECASLLAREGVEVTVLEQQHAIGGCLQRFERHGSSFDTGMHYVGGLDEGEHLWRAFDRLGLLDLPWKTMDRDGFERIVTPDGEYLLPMGHQPFARRLKEYFPQRASQIETYVTMLKEAGDTIGDSAGPRDKWLCLPAYDTLRDMFRHQQLLQVVSATAAKMDLDAARMPLYTFLQINDSYLRGAYRLDGGGDSITRRLKADIENAGGIIQTGTRVCRLMTEGDRVTKIIATRHDNSELQIEKTDWVIADIDPAQIMDMVKGAKLRQIYQRRLQQLPATCGMFTANLKVREDKIPYRNHNIHIINSPDVWHCHNTRLENVMVHFGNGGHIDLLSPMDWNVVELWAKDHNAAAYRQMKQRWLDDAISVAEKAIPSLRGNILESYTSTPLTYYRYNATPYGAAFGRGRDWRRGINSVVSTRTPVSNLLLTGQNLMLHGVLGVTMTAFDTINHILGANAINLKPQR